MSMINLERINIHQPEEKIINNNLENENITEK